jgi:hypothetical protein
MPTDDSAPQSDAAGWAPYLEGRTLGHAGAEGGSLIRDEVAAGDRLRLTLEEDLGRAFWAVTCVVEGWMVHARHFGSAAEANAALEAMRAPLLALLAALPPKPERPPGPAARAAGALLADFRARFP